MRTATTKAKLEFVFAMAKHSNATLRDCLALMRYGATLGRLAEDQCNREWTDTDELKRSRIKKQVRTLCYSIGGIEPIFQNDPRGCTLKLRVPDGYTNDWGKEGICVPTS